MYKKILLTALICLSFSCQKDINNPIKTTEKTLDSISAKNNINFESINFYNKIGLDEIEIEIKYSNKTLIVNTKKENERYKLNEVFYSNSVLSNPSITSKIKIFPYDIEPNKDKKEELTKIKDSISKDLKELKSSDSYDNQAINLVSKIFDGEKISLKIDKLDLEPNIDKNFVKFTKLNDKDFNLSINNNNMFIILEDNNKNNLFIRKGDFTINNEGKIVYKDKNYFLTGIILPNNDPKNKAYISNIDNLSRIYIKYTNENILNTTLSEHFLSNLPIAYFNDINNLSLENGFYLEKNKANNYFTVDLASKYFRNILVTY
ncbi:MAG: hypothetical protein U0457_00895 [Candidatus Sericytochromatia bacterium]